MKLHRLLAIFTLLFGLSVGGNAEQVPATRVFVCGHSFMIFTAKLLPDEGIDNFTKLGLEENPDLRALVQASWPGSDGHWNGCKNEQRTDRYI